MRIISDFRDYYDSAQGVAQDRELTYHRKRRVITINRPLNELHTLLASRGVADAKPNWRESAWAAAMVESILNERDAIAKNRDDWRTFSDNAMPLLVAAKRDLATLAVMLIVTFVLLMAAVVRLCCLTSEGVGVRKTAIVPVQTPVPLVAPAVFAPPIPPVVVIRQQSALQPFILTAQPRKEPRR